MPLSPLARLAVAMLLAPALWLSAPDARAATVNELLAGASLEAGGLRIGVASARIPGSRSDLGGNRLSYDVLSVAADSRPGFVTIDVFATESVNITRADT